jgi:hypothetical protein
MALLEDMFKGNAVTGLAVGLGTVMLAPTLLPAAGRVLRPAAKAVIKGGMVLYRETIAEVGELASDLVAEARSELNAEPQAAEREAGETAAIGGESAAKPPHRVEAPREAKAEKH